MLVCDVQGLMDQHTEEPMQIILVKSWTKDERGDSIV